MHLVVLVVQVNPSPCRYMAQCSMFLNQQELVSFFVRLSVCYVSTPISFQHGISKI